MAIIGKTQTTGTDGNLLKRFKRKVETFLGLKNTIDEGEAFIRMNVKGIATPPAKRINIEKKSKKVLLWRRRNKIASYSRKINRLRFA